MAAGIAHDLNNMLAAILGQIELLKLRGAPPDLQDGLATLETAASDGAQVVRRLQDFARQRAASPLVPMDLAPAVQEALEITRPRWQDELQQRGKTIGVHPALGDLPPILGHAPEIREVLTNLIFNAVDAMPDGGRLTSPGRPPRPGVPGPDGYRGGHARGRPPEDLRALLHHQGGQGHRARPGRGVQHPGAAWRPRGRDLRARPGDHRHPPLPGRGAEAPAPAAAPSLRPASRRLLLIDDEPAVRTTMGTLLRAVGHEVTEAESGPDGLASLADPAGGSRDHGPRDAGNDRLGGGATGQGGPAAPSRDSADRLGPAGAPSRPRGRTASIRYWASRSAWKPCKRPSPRSPDRAILRTAPPRGCRSPFGQPAPTTAAGRAGPMAASQTRPKAWAESGTSHSNNPLNLHLPKASESPWGFEPASPTPGRSCYLNEGTRKQQSAL